jgi:hypothetical protein
MGSDEVENLVPVPLYFFCGLLVYPVKVQQNVAGPKPTEGDATIGVVKREEPKNNVMRRGTGCKQTILEIMDKSSIPFLSFYSFPW